MQALAVGPVFPGSARKMTVILTLLLSGLRMANAQPGPVRTHIKRVIVYDADLLGGHTASRSALRQSMAQLSVKYHFQLDTTDQASDINAGYLSGAQILVCSNGEGDVFKSPASKQAAQDFVEKDGHAILMIHGAGSFVPCPTAGLEDLSDTACAFLARVAVRQYLVHNANGTAATVYVDSVAKGQVPPHAKAGTPASLFDHGISSAETRNIFAGLPRAFPGLKDEWFGFRDTPRLQGDMTVNGEAEGRVNVLLSLDENTFTPNQEMGDHPIAWTRKMGKGLGAFNASGHNANAGDVLFFQQDSVMQRFNWQLMRYLAKDFAGCMDSGFAEYNPEATVSALTPGDPANPCLTPVTVIKTGSRRGDVSATAGRRTISVTLDSDGKHAVKVADVRGQSVFSATLSGRRELVVPGLRIGIYFVTVSSPKGKTVRKVDLF